MNDQQKHKCYDNAVKALPNRMTINDLLTFIHGICGVFDADPELIAVALLTAKPSDEEELVQEILEIR